MFNLYGFSSKRSFYHQHYSLLCFTITYSRTSTGKAQSTQCTFHQQVQYQTSANGHISNGQAAPAIGTLAHCARPATSITKGLQTQQQTQTPQKRKQHQHLVNVSKCSQSAVFNSNKLPTYLTSPMSLGSSRWTLLNLDKFYHLHKLKAMCCIIQMNTCGHVPVHL